MWRRSAAAVAAAALLAVPAAGARPAADGPSRLQTLIWRGVPVYCGGTAKGLVALTFDDGPGPWTDRLVATLRRGHARATFFMVGDRLAYWPRQATAAASLGAIGNHTWSHPHMRSLPPTKIRGELSRTQQEIFLRTRQLSSLFRPPYEESTRRIDRVAKALNLLQVRWNVDSGDSRPGATAAGTVANVARAVRPGSIVLLHDTHPWTADAVASILRVLRAKHLRPVSVPDLIERDPPTWRQLDPAGPRC
jgi:peptidoglycan/xylan/chitin deacetylase (PgdA/CDA1 family)